MSYKGKTTEEILICCLDKLFQHSNCIAKRQPCKAVPMALHNVEGAYWDWLEEREAKCRMTDKKDRLKARGKP